MLYAASETASVTANVTGPGSGNPGDPNPVNSAQIQINVKQSGIDSFTNNTANPINPNVLVNGASENSTTTSGNQGANTLGYTTAGTGGNATITATFQATISATGANGKFTVGAALNLSSTFLNVTIGNNGVNATSPNAAPKADPNFQSMLPYNAAFTYTVTVPNVADNTNLGISYSSSLNSSLGGNGAVVGFGPPPNPNFGPGTTTDNVSFNWSLTYNIG